MAKKPAHPESHVFINVPFDSAYEPLFLALLAALIGRGFVPRSVLEIPPDQNRLARLLELIQACGLSLHDLSRVTLSKGSFRVPRFNMPFELGLAVAVAAVARSTPNHQWRLLEARSYRLQQSLSDLNGFDPVTHKNQPRGMLAAVANLFPRHEVDDAYIHELYKELVNFRCKNLKGALYTPRAFERLVRAAEMMVAAGA